MTVGGAQTSPCSFFLATGDTQLATSGVHRRLSPGPARTLGDRVAHFFEESAAQAASGPKPGLPASNLSAPDLLVGAIPFNREADDFLFQPERVTSPPLPPQSGEGKIPHRWTVRPEPDRRAYEASVNLALNLIKTFRDQTTPLSKIVLSRSLLLEADEAIDTIALYHRLGGDAAVARFLTPLGPGADGRPRALVGATPELLLSKTGASILSHPLAGSARRGTNPTEDREAAQSLLQSPKDLREHRWVTEAILDLLTPYCSQLTAPNSPALVSTNTMWHLGTRIEGVLKNPESPSSAELAALLHPTPAVGGVPRDKAVMLIPGLERYDRGFYAGAVGWTGPTGDGAWYVSLRCAEVSGRKARVYAGAGIVDGSVPSAEADETSAKLQAILQALGIDENGLASRI